MLSFYDNQTGIYDYILVDQGIIQNIASIVYNEEIAFPSNVVPIIQIMTQLADKHIVINTIIDRVESKSSLCNRKNGQIRIEKMNRNDYMEIDSVHKRKFLFIRNQIADKSLVFDIHTEDIVSVKVNKIVDILGEDKQ